MMNKFETTAKKLFYPTFVAAFGWVMLNTIFKNPFYDYKWYVSLPLAAAWCGLFWLLYRVITKYSSILQDKKLLCLGGFFILLSLTQIVFYYFCAGYPTRDFEKVFVGAYNYTIGGEILDPYLDYFYKFPNNMPITIVLQFIFRAFYKFGFTQFFIIGALFNAFCIDLAYLFTFLCGEKLSNTKTGFFAIMIMYFCLPLQTYISIFYTDTTTMLYPPMIIYFFLLISQAKSVKKALPPLALMGIMAGFGIKIKYSVVIALIAVCVQCILKYDFKRLIACVASVAIGFTLVSGVIDGFMYRNVLDKDKAYDMATPFIAWITMGMQGDGMHDSGDNAYVWARDTHEEKVQAAKHLMKLRLDYMGVGGYLDLLNRKAVRSFGSGDFDYPNTVSDSPMKQNFAIDLLNSGGKYYHIYDNIIQGYHVLIFIMLILSGVLAIKKKDYKYFLPQLAAFGMLLFLLLWEAGTRYLLNYYPIFILCALPMLTQLFSSKEKQ
ncbi:MAG: hypothetical protein RRX95_07160 [Oscillospiraceae bacterium]